MKRPGWEQSGLAGDVPAYSSGVGLDDLQWFLPTQTILWSVRTKEDSAIAWGSFKNCQYILIFLNLFLNLHTCMYWHDTTDKLKAVCCCPSWFHTAWTELHKPLTRPGLVECVGRQESSQLAHPAQHTCKKHPKDALICTLPRQQILN